ncbi:MAG: molecular chaperone TorD family protein [Planctomycetes bacterium]|nr:molecular chaperone TorD family protein [Planctomycetota bacterium]
MNSHPSNPPDLFAALSLVFAKPEANQVCHDPVNPLLSALGVAANEEWRTKNHFQDLFNRLWDGLTQMNSISPEKAFHDLEVEFARLFLVPSNTRIMPYEHSITGKSPALLAASLQASYQEYGLSVTTIEKDLPDHISTQLEFVARILGTDDVKIARSFVQDHLGAFGRAFAAGVLEKTQCPLYEVAANTLIQLLSMDYLNLETNTNCIEC